MRGLTTLVAATVAAGTIATGIAVSGGGPPPTDPPAPDPHTVVAHGVGTVRVAEPAKRTNASVERAVRAARRDAIPRAVERARDEARTLAEAAGLKVSEPVGVARDVSPVGWFDEDTGRFGVGRWCGPITTYRRGHRRVHHGCHKPPRVTVRVTLTLAAA
ncbi:MAG TPA: hypothetical protein VF587_14975 [Solirubrobacteraceae bacterium]|jgi:hypothetical protein